MKTLKLTIPDNRPLSTNVVDRMNRWKKKDNKYEVYLRVYAAIPPEVMDNPWKPHCRPYFTEPVSIEFVSYQTGNIQDKDNPYIKPYIDALVHYGIIQDDDDRYVKRVWRHVERSPTKEQYVVITIETMVNRATTGCNE